MSSRRLNILGINGSASRKSSNLAILKFIAEAGKDTFDLKFLEDLSGLPHFATELTNENIPSVIVKLRNEIEKADGIIICTPEYVFSIPSRLKNMIEWCVSTTVFSGKPVGLITASANGVQGHEELKLIMKTIQALFTEETTILIQGVKGKLDSEGRITNSNTEVELRKLVLNFGLLIKK